jgi:hypothetical protein
MVTILFGIEAPLCATACLVSSDTSPLTIESPSVPSSAMSCHESKRGDPPADSGNTHDDCGCDFSVAGLLSDSPAGDSNSTHEMSAVRRRLDSRLPIRNREMTNVTFGNQLPPPDILLLKSTFLI